jgi:hypothetical protein
MENSPQSVAVTYLSRKFRNHSDIFTLASEVVEELYGEGEEGMLKSKVFINLLSLCLGNLPQFIGKRQQIGQLLVEAYEKKEGELKLIGGFGYNTIIPTTLFPDKKGEKVLATADNFRFLLSCYGLTIRYSEIFDTVLIFEKGVEISNHLGKAIIENLLSLNSLPASLFKRLHLVSLSSPLNSIKDWITSAAFNGKSQLTSLKLTPVERTILIIFCKQVLNGVFSGGKLPYLIQTSLKDCYQLFPPEFGKEVTGLFRKVNSSGEYSLACSETEVANRAFIGKGIEIKRRESLIVDLSSAKMVELIRKKVKVLPIGSILSNGSLEDVDKQQFWAELLTTPTPIVSEEALIRYLIDGIVREYRVVNGVGKVRISLEKIAKQLNLVGFEPILAASLSANYYWRTEEGYLF